jgi:hypothetical protein
MALRGRIVWVILAAASVSGLRSRAWAGADMISPDFALGVGYAEVGIGDEDSVIEAESALRFDGYLGFSPLEDLPQLRLGGAMGVSMVLDDAQFAFISSGGATFVGRAEMPLLILEPEVRLSWCQYLDRAETVYIEPGVGFGGAIAFLSLDGEGTSAGDSFSESDATFTTRAFVNIGVRVTGGLAGLQASWAQGGEINLADNAQGDFSQFYIGLFGALSF